MLIIAIEGFQGGQLFKGISPKAGTSGKSHRAEFPHVVLFDNTKAGSSTRESTTNDFGSNGISSGLVIGPGKIADENNMNHISKTAPSDNTVAHSLRKRNSQTTCATTQMCRMRVEDSEGADTSRSESSHMPSAINKNQNITTVKDNELMNVFGDESVKDSKRYFLLLQKTFSSIINFHFFRVRRCRSKVQHYNEGFSPVQDITG